MARQDNDRVEKPPLRRRIVTGDTASDAGAPERSYPTASPYPEMRDNSDPLADLAPVYSVDELAPVYGSPTSEPAAPDPSGPTRAVRAQPAVSRPPRPERGPTPGTTPVSPRRTAASTQPGFDDLGDTRDDDEEDESPRWPRVLILTAGLLTSLGLIAYGVSGLFTSSPTGSDETSTEESDEDGATTTSNSSLDLQPVSIQGEPLELQDVALPDIPIQARRIFEFGESTAVVSTHPSNSERLSMVGLDNATRTWTVAPDEIAFTAIGPAPDGLVAIADNGGAFSLVQSSDSGASWAPIDGASELPSSEIDLIARNDAGIIFARSEQPGDHRAEASSVLAAAGVELPANMIAAVSPETITYFENDSEETSWWLLPSYTASWADFGLDPQTQWAPNEGAAPRTLYRWTGDAIEEIQDPFGAGQYLLTLDTTLGEFRATTYDATAVGYSEWRSPDGATWSAFGSLTRPPLAPAPPSAIQRVSLDGIEWQILTVPEREPVIARRAEGSGEWTAVDAASVIDGTDLTGYKPVSLTVADRVLTLGLDGPDGQASVIAQSTDANSWKVADIMAPHVEASVDGGSLIAFGVSDDPLTGPPTLNAVRAS